MDRIRIWLDPFSSDLDRDLTHQTRQSLYAIGSGGLLGVGLGQSRQKYLYLPAPQNDFIFAIVCEELGFVGALVIIVLFALLIWRGCTCPSTPGISSACCWGWASPSRWGFRRC